MAEPTTIRELAGDVEKLAAEIARARGESATALEFVRGTPNKIGLRERVQSSEDAIEHLRDREQERWQAVDASLSRIERGQHALGDRMTALERSRVSPAAVWVTVIAIWVACASAGWSVFGPRIREEYALFMGCKHHAE